MKVSVFCELKEEDRARLRAALPEADFSFAPTAEDVAHSRIILGEIPVAMLAHAGELEWLQLSMAGTDPYTLDASVLPAGVLLTNATGAFGLAIAEHMIGCLFMLQKKLHLYRDQMAEHLWINRGTVGQIEGSRVLVVGLGDLGCAFAEKMKALGCHVIGVRRTQAAKPSCVDECYVTAEIDRLLPTADVVALCLPGTSGTAGLFHRARLCAMKQGAILLNVGRGSAVDTDALAELLTAGHLGGAALDVTDPEPLPPTHPLWECENALITPHVAGKYYLPQTYRNIVAILEENLRRYAMGKPLMNVVDRKTGYCVSDAENEKIIK